MFGKKTVPNIESNALKFDTPILYITVISWRSINGSYFLPYLNTKIQVPASRGRIPNAKDGSRTLRYDLAKVEKY